MGISSQIRNGGWGALAIYVYSLFVLVYWKIPYITFDRLALAVAAVPALIVMFLVVVLNDWLNDYWAGGHLKESSREIAQITGKNDFYHSATPEIQDAVDDFDEKAYGHHIAIISGVILAVAAPITGYVVFGLIGVMGGMLVSLVSIRTLSIRSYRELNQLAKDLSTPYMENYENQ